MKTPLPRLFLAALVALLGLCHHATAALHIVPPTVGPDLRRVNGRTVDLAPLHDWTRTNGPAKLRPLTHWRLAAVETLGTPNGAWRTCTLSVEGRGTQTVYAMHVPRPILEAHQAIETARLRADEALRQARAAALERDRLERIWRQNAYNDCETYRRSSHRCRNTCTRNDLAYLNWRSASRAADDSAAASAAARDQSELAARSVSYLWDYAMFTGQRYAGREVWDFGR